MSLAAKKDSASISILPDSDERTLCLNYTGLITMNDYNNYVKKPLISIVKKNPHYGLLVHYDQNFRGWDKNAADLSFKTIIEYGPNARKLAYVNPPESKIFQVKMFAHLFGGEIRFFEKDHLKEAIQWVKA